VLILTILGVMFKKKNDINNYNKTIDIAHLKKDANIKAHAFSLTMLAPGIEANELSYILRYILIYVLIYILIYVPNYNACYRTITINTVSVVDCQYTYIVFYTIF